jgi:hypothetical protein
VIRRAFLPSGRGASAFVASFSAAYRPEGDIIENDARLLVRVALCAAALAAPSISHAQSGAAFPAKTVTLVVPFTASSGSDIIARIIGPKLAAR